MCAVIQALKQTTISGILITVKAGWACMNKKSIKRLDSRQQKKKIHKNINTENLITFLQRAE
jgi:hypothetical protein